MYTRISLDTFRRKICEKGYRIIVPKEWEKKQKQKPNVNTKYEIRRLASQFMFWRSQVVHVQTWDSDRYYSHRNRKLFSASKMRNQLVVGTIVCLLLTCHEICASFIIESPIQDRLNELGMQIHHKNNPEFLSRNGQGIFCHWPSSESNWIEYIWLFICRAQNVQKICEHIRLPAEERCERRWLFEWN